MKKTEVSGAWNSKDFGRQVISRCLRGQNQLSPLFANLFPYIVLIIFTKLLHGHLDTATIF